MSSCLCVFLSGYVIYGFYGVTMNGFLKIFSFGFICFFFGHLKKRVHLFIYLLIYVMTFIVLFIYLSIHCLIGIVMV